MQTQFQEGIGEIVFSANFVNFLQTNSGGEYLSEEFKKRSFHHQGPSHRVTTPDTPEQNGMAEQMNQTLINLATAMLIASGLPMSFWSDTMLTAAFIIVQTPATGLQGRNPYEELFSNYSHPPCIETHGPMKQTIIVC